MHSLILGPTGCGKTTLAKRLVHGAISGEVPVLILDPSGHDWCAEFGHPDIMWQTTNIDEYMEVVFGNERCLLIVDEAGEAIGRAMSTDTAHRAKLATRTRHRGHRAVFIAQRATMINATIPRQCSQGWIFRQHADDLKMLARTFTNDNVMRAMNLQPGRCIYVKNDGFFEEVLVHNYGLDTDQRHDNIIKLGGTR